MYTQHIIGLLAFLIIVIYLGSIGYLMRYLRRVYTMIWIDLGEPTLWGKRTLTNPFGYLRDGGLGVLRFVFSSQYKNLDDSQLANLIWIVRASFIASIMMAIILFVR